LKKWLPFFLMLGVALLSSVYLILSGGDNMYIPKTRDASVIYKEACVDCHGSKGEGDGLLYPAFDYSELNLQIIKDKITNGDWRMPKFKYIKNDTLEILARFIMEKKYLKKQ